MLTSSPVVCIIHVHLASWILVQVVFSFYFFVVVAEVCLRDGFRHFFFFFWVGSVLFLRTNVNDCCVISVRFFKMKLTDRIEDPLE